MQVLDGSFSCRLGQAKSYGRPEGYFAADLGKMALVIAFLTNIDGYFAIGSLIDTIMPLSFVCFNGSGPGRNRSSLKRKYELLSAEQHYIFTFYNL